MKRKTTNEILKKLTKGDIEKLEKNKLIYLHKDHALPVTRRDFLKTGLLTFSGTMMAPNILNLISSEAKAQADACSVANSLPGFIHINMEGGFGLSGNFLARTLADKTKPLSSINDESNLVYLNNYSLVGLGQGPSNPGILNVKTNLFANPFPAALSTDPNTGGMFFGKMAQVATTALAQTSCTAICVSSQDDSSTNKFGPQGVMLGMMNKLNSKFQIYPNLSNVNSATNTGVRQANSSRVQSMAPIIVDSAKDINSILGLTNDAADANENLAFSAEENRLSKELINNLSQEQSRGIASIINSLTDKFKSVLLDSTGKNVLSVNCPTPIFDPLKDTANPQIATIWNNVRTIIATADGQTGRGPNANSISVNGEAGGIATLAYAATKGFAGTVGISLGGYDYHGDNRNNQDAADSKAGAIIGGALETAKILGRPLFIFVTSDGAVGSNQTAAFGQFTSDRGIGGSALMIMFHPTQSMAAVDSQLGYYTSGIGAADDTLVSSPEKATQAAFYRFMKFANVPNWQTIGSDLLQDAAFSTSELAYILGKIG